MPKIVVERQVAGDGKYSIGDGDVASLEAGIARDNLGVDAGHCGGIAVDQDVAVAVLHVEDGIVGLHPDAGAVAHEERGTDRKGTGVAASIGRTRPGRSAGDTPRGMFGGRGGAAVRSDSRDEVKDRPIVIDRLE